MNRGGILAPGAGVARTGEAGRGISSRWYPETLARRIRAIGGFAGRITFVQGDALDAIEQHSDRISAAFFIDPPYTAGGKRAGGRLYRHHELDHERLFQLAGATVGDVLLTYDNADEVKRLALLHGFVAEPIAMKTTHHAHLSELLIARDLAWTTTLRTAA